MRLKRALADAGSALASWLPRYEFSADDLPEWKLLEWDGPPSWKLLEWDGPPSWKLLEW